MVEWFQVLWLKTNNSICYLSFVCSQNGFEYSEWLNSSFLPRDGTLTVTTTTVQSEHRSNSNKRVHRIPHISKAGASPSDIV